MKPRKTEYLVNGIDPYDFTKKKVGSVEIYSRQVPWSSCIHVRFLFDVGAMHDPKGKEGLTHFLEHMLFAGSSKYPDKFAIDQFSKTHTIDSLHAFTTFANICLYFKCLSEHLEDALEGSVDILTESLFTEEAVTKERGVIEQEVWGFFKNQKRIDYTKKDVDNIFQSFPERRRVPYAAGWPETVQTITQKDVVAHREKYLVQENLKVIIVGNFNESHLKLIQKIVQKIPSGTAAKPVTIPKVIQKPKENIWIHTYEEIGLASSKQAYIEIGSGEPQSARKKSGIEQLTRALMYELLFQELRHKNSWCYGVGVNAGNAVDYKHANVNSKVDPAHIHSALTTMEQVLQDIVLGKHAKEFEQEKMLSLEKKRATEVTTEDIVGVAERYLMNRLPIETRKEIFEGMRSVTYKDIQEYIQKMLVDSKNKVYEIQVPENYDKEKTFNFLKENLKKLNRR